mmetsp:Transcript_90638/g.281868  ORF Transcript_90638/g.281868 Transcript_90638/m.281868 type:complete len:363 (+) Transcript_90638:85-1173(+)
MVEVRRLAEAERRIQILEDLLTVRRGTGAGSQGKEPLAAALSKAEAAAVALACGTAATAATASSSWPGEPEQPAPSSQASAAEESAAEELPAPQAAMVRGLHLGPVLSGRQAQAPCAAVPASRRCGGPPSGFRRDAQAPGGCPSSAVTSAAPTPRFTGRSASAAPSSPRSAGGEEAAASAGIAAALRQLEARFAQPMQQRLASVLRELEAAREQAREHSKQNALLQRRLEEQRQLLARVTDFEEQNLMFSARALEDSPMYERLPEFLAEERLEWERCRLAAEDLAVERCWQLEREAAAQLERERLRKLAEEMRDTEHELAGLGKLVDELQLVHNDAERKAADNRAMLRKIEKLRSGPPRWRN